MPAATPTVLVLTLSAVLGLAPWQAATAAEPPAGEATADQVTAPPADPSIDQASLTSHEVRRELSELLRQHPPELATILTLDPTLLSSEAFLAGYPALDGFVAAHPEVRRNPGFYLAEFQPVTESRSIESVVEMLMIFSTFLLISLALAWFIRTVIEQKRWSRLSRTQSEVHNKILDRFGTSEELLDYMRTPAGGRFLESAPIPLYTDRPAPSGAPSRVTWSIQIGVVVAAAALGMLLVGLRYESETAEGLFAMGAIGLCVGAGFVASAVVSTFLSRRLGVWESGRQDRPASAGQIDESGMVG